MDAISRVLNKYVDFQKLYIKSAFGAEPIEFLDHCGDSCLVLRFNEPLEDDRIEVFTVVRGRFIEFEMELLSEADPKYPAPSYLMKITRCSIALEKREHERLRFDERRPGVTNMSTIKVRERENEFRKSLSVRMIIEEFVGKLEGFDFKRVLFKDDRDIPPTVRFVMESGRPLHLPDLSHPEVFFRDTAAFFEESNSADLKEELRHWIQNNTANMRSVLVRPVTYYPLVGAEFTIGYLVVINREASIDDAMVGSVDAFIRDLSEKIRNGNLADSRTAGSVVDVSAGGVKIDCSDSKLMDRLVSQNVVVFEMNFREDAALLISGRIVYVFKRDDGGYFVGVDFRGSHFGPSIRNVLPLHIRHFQRDMKR